MKQAPVDRTLNRWGVVIVAAVAIYAVHAFIQPFNGNIFEPDSHLEWTAAYREVIASRDLSKFDTIKHGTPHLDGPTTIYALLSYVVDAGARLLFSHSPFASAFERDVFTLKYTNATMYVLAAIFLYLAALRLSRSWWCAALVSLALLGCSQFYMIDLTRIDYIINVFLVAVLYLCIVLLQDGASARVAIALGAACGAHAASKWNGFFIFAFPGLALLLKWSPPRDWFRFIAYAAPACVATIFILLLRYFAQIGDVLEALRMQFAALNTWAEFLGTTPRLYYNVDLFGFVPNVPDWQKAFIQRLWIAVGTLVVTMLPVTAVVRRQAQWLFFPVLLLVFSVAGLFVLKYSRGGHHLVPIYLLGLAACVGAARELHVARAGRIAFAALPSLILACLVALQTPALYGAMLASADKYASVQITRFAARDWIVNNIKPNARVCLVINTDWTGPPLEGLGYRRNWPIFQIPYMERAAMATYEPPPVEDVRRDCDFVLLTDCIVHMSRAMFVNWRLPELAERWQALWVKLRSTVTPFVFEAPTVAYCTKRTEVFVLNPEVMTRKTER